MKSLNLLLLALLVGASSVALAGPERSYSAESKQMVQPMAAPVCDWTGFYLGGNVGWRGGRSSWIDDNGDGNGNTGELISENNESGVIGGLQVGYNRQFNSWFVMGLELTGSYAGGDSDKTFVEPGEETKHFSTENDWSGTLALRFGVTGMNNKLLFYGKAGGAFSHWDYEYINDESPGEGRPEFDRYNEEDTFITPMVGVGVEYAFNCHWSAKVEWNHLFIDKREQNPGRLVEDFETDDFEKFTQTVRFDSFTAGINYKF